VTVQAFLVTLEARPGREADVAAVLREAHRRIGAESGSELWVGFHSGGTTFGILDAYDTKSNRQVQLHCQVRKAIEAHGELFSAPPVITPVDVLDEVATLSG
jgi:hypothetical protein